MQLYLINDVKYVAAPSIKKAVEIAEKYDAECKHPIKRVNEIYAIIHKGEVLVDEESKWIIYY